MIISHIRASTRFKKRFLNLIYEILTNDEYYVINLIEFKVWLKNSY
jgi:hypothetical protein